MGYMVLRHARKVAVYRDGERVREWPVPQGESLVDPLQHMLSGPYHDALLSGSTAFQAAWRARAGTCHDTVRTGQEASGSLRSGRGLGP
jgi:hypothetical protein